MKIASSLFLAATTLVATSSLMAWESADGQHSTSAGVAMSSDYVWRGYSQTDSEPAIAGGFDYGHASGLYAGAWASNVDFADSPAPDANQAHIEMDLYVGYTNEIGDTGVGYDIGAVHYFYPGTDNLGWNEYSVAFSYSYFSAGVAYTDEVFGSDEHATYYSLDFDYNLPMNLAFKAGVGRYHFHDGDSPNDYHLGVSTKAAGLGWDLTYAGTDSQGQEFYGDSVADGHFIFTLSKSL